MSIHSASPSPLQVAANGEPDEAKMPKGHCRYILLQPEIRGQRCACASFSLNKGIPGSTCDCGHLACFHNNEPDAPTDQKHEFELLKKRIQLLENQISRGQEDVLDSVVSRLNEVEEHLEKSREEFGEQIKGAYRNVSLSWRSIEQAERKNQQQDDQLREVYDKLRNHDEQLDRLHGGQLELRDADLSLEERIENLTETLEEEEEWRLAAVAATASGHRPRRRSTSDTPRPSLPLTPLGPGAALSDLYLRPSPSSPAGGPGKPHHPSEPGDGPLVPGAATTPHHHRFPAPSTAPTGAWTVHISLLPHAAVPMPFERNTNAYQRCLSRGLHRMVAVQGRDAASFRAAVEKAFGTFLRGRAWMPLQAKLCDAETLQGLPMLRPLEPGLMAMMRNNARGWDHDFLRAHCAVTDASGVMDSLYIAMCPPHSLSWHTLRRSPVFMEGLEGCWAYDPLLDGPGKSGSGGSGSGSGSGIGIGSGNYNGPGSAAISDDGSEEGGSRRPAAGDITVIASSQVKAGVVAGPGMHTGGGGGGGLKRPLSEMRAGSFGPVAAGSGPGPGGEAGDEARVKRACPAVPVPGAGGIVEMRRRDIKTA